MSLNGSRPSGATACTCHNHITDPIAIEQVSPVGLVDLLVIAQPDPLSRRELAVFRSRFMLWRREIVDRIQRQIDADPLTPVAGDQQMIRRIDDAIAALDRYVAQTDTPLRRRLGMVRP